MCLLFFSHPRIICQVNTNAYCILRIQVNLGVQGVIIHVFAPNDGVHSLLTRASDARVALMHVHLWIIDSMGVKVVIILTLFDHDHPSLLFSCPTQCVDIRRSIRLEDHRAFAAAKMLHIIWPQEREMETTSANRLLTVNLPLGGQKPSGCRFGALDAFTSQARFLELT